MRFVPVIASVGAAALLAGVSVVAADSHNAHGKAVSAVATSKATEGEGHGDAVSAAAKARETVRTSAVKPVVRTNEAKPAVSVACGTAMANLKAAVAADRIEDQSERKARVVTGTTEANEATAIKSNGSTSLEDASELTALRNAFTSVRAACVRPLETETAACTAAENAVLLTSLEQAEGCPD